MITFGPDGAYGHPDHVAISQLTTAAVVRAADREYAVSKLYYIAWGASTWAAYQAALKKLTSLVDGVERQVIPTPDWRITTRIDTGAVWPAVWPTVARSQDSYSMAGFDEPMIAAPDNPAQDHVQRRILAQPDRQRGKDYR